MKYWFITIHRTAKRDAVSEQIVFPMLKAHTAYIKQIWREGHCIIAGPFVDQGIKELGAGFYVVAQEDESAARKLADNDPLIAEGYYDYRLVEWTKVVPE